MNIPGIGPITESIRRDFNSLETGGNGLFRSGTEGVKAIFTPLDKFSELIVYEDKTLVFINSEMGYPAIYPLEPARFESPAEAVLMDLDGTSVHSEHFCILGDRANHNAFARQSEVPARSRRRIPRLGTFRERTP